MRVFSCFFPFVLFYNENMKLHKAAYTVYKTEISYRLDNPITKEDFSNWGKKLSENKTSGNKETLPWLGIYKDRNKERSCLFIYSNFPEVSRK